YFKTVQGGASVSSPRCEQNDVDLTADSRHSLAADLRAEATTPNFVFIAPDNAHNMHDRNVAQADRSLQDSFTRSDVNGAPAAGGADAEGLQPAARRRRCGQDGTAGERTPGGLRADGGEDPTGGVTRPPALAGWFGRRGIPYRGRWRGASRLRKSGGAAAALHEQRAAG